MKRTSLAVCFSVFCFLVYGRAQESGTIRGAVVDDVGKPVVTAQVIVDPADGRPRSNGVRLVETDGSGRFSMGNLAMGTYKVFAKKDSAGYPDTSFAFYSNHMFTTATLTSGAPEVDLILKVGPAASMLTGLVTDAEGHPINATFLLRRASDRDNWISMSQRPEYRILVPPSTDVLLEVSAPGCKTWYYGGPADALGRSPIRLESGKQMKLDVQLHPDDKIKKGPDQE
jgi:Carboxypeptidase regulatory-like domain